MFSAMIFSASATISQLKQTIGLIRRHVEMNNMMTYPRYDGFPAKSDGFGRKIDGNGGRRGKKKGEKRKRSSQLCNCLIIPCLCREEAIDYIVEGDRHMKMTRR
jgi:hypothetical protein